MSSDLEHFDRIRESIRDAFIHQTRQPLFTLQNYLSAVSHLAKRMSPDPNLELMENCFSEMRSSIQQLAGSLDRLCDFESNGGSAPVNTDLLPWITETFQIAGSISRRLSLSVEWTINPGISGSLFMESDRVQIRLLQWILNACFQAGRRGTSLPVVSADPIEGDLVIHVRTSFEDATLRVSSLIFSSEDDPTTSAADP